MKRAFFRGWPWRSISLLAIVLGMWASSYWWQPRIMLWRHTTRTVCELENGRVRLLYFPVYVYDYDVDIPLFVTAWCNNRQAANGASSESGPYTRSIAERDHYLMDGYASVMGGYLSGVSVLGFQAHRSELVLSTGPMPFYVVEVPCWHLAVAAGLLSLCLLMWRRRRRFLPEHCCKCGYDLWRATPERCPECGTVSRPVQRAFRRRSEIGRVWAPAHVRIRRNALPIGTGLLLIGLILRPVGIPRGVVGVIDEPEKFVAAHQPADLGDSWKPFTIIYNVADLYDARRYAPEKGQDPDAYWPLLSNHDDSLLPGKSDDLQIVPPYIFAHLSADEHVTLINQLNQWRRVKK